jgi:hypothetical protein
MTIKFSSATDRRRWWTSGIFSEAKNITEMYEEKEMGRTE